MINELARMHFQSATRPAEKGALVLTEDGFFNVEPSEEFLAELTRLEAVAVSGANHRGYLVGGILIAAGAAFAVLTWLASRIGGEMRETLTESRPAEEVVVAADDHGGIQVILPGVGPQKVQLTWEAGETNSEEAAQFLSAHRQLKESMAPKGR